MFLGDISNWLIACVVLLLGVAFYAQRVDGRVKLMKMRMDRQSLTFLKIENDLSAIQDSLLIMSQATGGETAEIVADIRARRPQILKYIIERGPNGAEVLRGLEFPDMDDDPIFWADDRMKRFGLEDEEHPKDAATP